MTIVLAADCSALTITSDFLLADNQENLLSVTYNGTTEYTPEIAANITSLSITPALLGLEGTTLADGIYYIKLTTRQDDGTIKIEESCAPAVLCGKDCSILDYYLDSANNVDKLLAYEGLKAAQGCVTCSCAKLLTLYAVLTDVTNNDCGCEQN